MHELENYLVISKITPQTLDQYWSTTFSFQIADGHYPAEGDRGGRHGLQAAERAALPARVRDPAHLVHLHPADRAPHRLPLPLLRVPVRRLGRCPEVLWLSRADGRAEGDVVQVQGGGDLGKPILHFEDTSLEHLVEKKITMNFFSQC